MTGRHWAQLILMKYGTRPCRPDHRVVTSEVVATLKARIEALQSELSKLEAAAAAHRGPSVNATGRSFWSLSCWQHTADMMNTENPPFAERNLWNVPLSVPVTQA